MPDGMAKFPSLIWPDSVYGIWPAWRCRWSSVTWNTHRFVITYYFFWCSAEVAYIILYDDRARVESATPYPSPLISTDCTINNALFFFCSGRSANVGRSSGASSIDSRDQLFVVFGSHSGTCSAVHAQRCCQIGKWSTWLVLCIFFTNIVCMRFCYFLWNFGRIWRKILLGSNALFGGSLILLSIFLPFMFSVALP